MPLSAENTAVVLDSTADLPDPRGRHPNWRLVPLYVRFGDETLQEYVDISPEEFYRRLRESSAPPKSSQPSPADFQAAFESLSQYEHILCVVLSAKISGTYESARLAAEGMEEGRVKVIDSGVTSGGTVILVDAIQRRLEAGTDEAEIDAVVERFKQERGLLFTVDTLEYLIRGGRIGKAAGLAGQLLSVKPILVLDDGEVAPLKRIRGRGKAIAELASKYNGDNSAAPEKAKLTPTGRKETINGYEAEEFVRESPTMKESYWIALKFPDSAAIVKQLQAVIPSAWNEVAKGMFDFSDFPGLPLRTVVKRDGKEITSTMVSIKQDLLSDTEFFVPNDFQELKIPNIPQLNSQKPAVPPSSSKP